MTVRRVKNAILAVLVALSLFLTYMLWAWNWEASGGISFTPATQVPPADHPQTTDLTAPDQLVFAAQSGYSLAMPGSAGYAEWVSKLQTLHIQDLRLTQSVPHGQALASVQFHFGSKLEDRELEHWLPGIQASALISGVQTMTLAAYADDRNAVLELSTGNGLQLADSGLPRDELVADVKRVIAASPWKLWSDAHTLVPQHGVHMQRLQLDAATLSEVPFVHTFFVNPAALTKVREGQDTDLWTDGSRVVWWNRTDGTLSFADPNPPPKAEQQESDLATTADFIRSHGGAPSATVIVRQDTAAGGTVYTLRTFVAGYPLLGDAEGLTVQTEHGIVVQYRRSLLQLQQQVAATDVTTYGYDRLVTILHALMPTTAPSSVGVQLGYYVRPLDNGHVELLPAYYVTQSGLLLWVLDAVSGQVVKGAWQTQ